MFYLFHGEDEYSRTLALAEMKAKVGDPSISQLNIISLDGEALTLEELIRACDAPPFLSQRRLVIVRDLASQLEPRRGAKKRGVPPAKRELVEGLKECLPQMPQSTRLVFIEGRRISKSNPIRRLASQLEGGFVREFRPPKGDRLRQWIREQVKEKGGQISPPAVEELTNFLGSDLRLLDQEIEKLLTYTGEHPIEKEDVHLLVSQVQTATIFSLVDALGHRDSRKATLYLHELMDAGQPSLYIFFMITRQFRLLLQAKELQIEGLGWQAIQTRLRLHPFVAQKLAQQVRNFSRSRLEAIHHRLLEVDIAIKTGQMEPQLALDLLAIELCTSRA